MAIYRSSAGRETMLARYDDALAALDIDVTERTVATGQGDTHLLLAGPADAPPLLVLHGGNATNPMTLSWYQGLADDYRLVAPDVVGQPGYSAETRPDPTGDGYGEWVCDVLDAVGSGSVSIVGTSYGAAIALRTAAVAPERIDRAGLVVPAGFGTGSIAGMAGLGTASMTYRFTGSERALEHALAALMTDPDGDPITRETVAASLRHVRLASTFPSATAAELADFDAPVNLFLAAEDPFFPPDRVEPTARERLSNVAAVTVLAGERHILSEPARERVTSTLRDFLAPDSADVDR